MAKGLLQKRRNMIPSGERHQLFDLPMEEIALPASATTEGRDLCGRLALGSDLVALPPICLAYRRWPGAPRR